MTQQQRTAVIAGVGAGLGASLCRAYANEGYQVYALARSRKDAALGESTRFIVTDLTSGTSQKEAFKEIIAETGRVDSAVYNASGMVISDFAGISQADFEQIWRVSTLGAFLFAQQALAPMAEAGHGSLLFTGATASIKGSAKFGAFASAKFALRGLVQSLAREYGPKGVHVAHTLLDGIIWSDRARDTFGMAEENSMNPDAIAAAYLDVAHQHKSAWTQELDLRPYCEKF